MSTTIAPDHTDLLSQTIVTYLGYGTHRSPGKNIRQVETITDDRDVLQLTRTIIRSVLTYEPTGDCDYDEDTAVANHARTLHPWLTDDALAAIVWNYFYGWR